MSAALEELADVYGIEPDYISERGEHCVIGEPTKRRLLHAMGVAAGTDQETEASLKEARTFGLGAENGGNDAPDCFIPDWLKEGRTWGITCQLYGLRSERNCGLGDFADLARLAEISAAAGADFLGVNPLHALFFADARRYSPYSPSSRTFLNPFYIAVDAWLSPAMKAEVRALQDAPLVDYVGVARIKRTALAMGYRKFVAAERRGPNSQSRAFRGFCAERATTLHRYALYEALSEEMVARGYYSGWHTWPVHYRHFDSYAVRQFERDNAQRTAFHKWLQWVAETQLRDAQARAKAAGMRIGLYLDLAVGVAPDGAETWSQPDSVISGVRIGCPPDMFNDNGQDWGLAPLSPAGLKSTDFQPFEGVLLSAMRNAGAVRVDHAMGLTRLYWIPGDAPAREGAYVRFPMREMFRRLAKVSNDCRAIVIGEDLGTVPVGFRERMSEVEIQGYRVLYFEREHDQSFRAPDAFTHRALACLTTHDLPTLRGWWRGIDIELRENVGASTPDNATAAREARREDRYRILSALSAAGLLPDTLRPVLESGAAMPADLPDEVGVAVHAYLGRTASRLVAVQIEDLVGMADQANVPGTVDEYANWRQKLPVALEDVDKGVLFQQTTHALNQQRPRTP
jgi:4-alpha-glucanotransferase